MSDENKVSKDSSSISSTSPLVGKTSETHHATHDLAATSTVTMSKAKKKAQELARIQTEVCESALEVKTGVTSPEAQNHRHPELFHRRQEFVASDFDHAKNDSPPSTSKVDTSAPEDNELKEKPTETKDVDKEPAEESD